MSTDKINSPSFLFGPNFHSANERHWFLLKFYIRLTPSWGLDYLKTRLCIFREIAYVNKENELVGLGRSYIPLNFFGLLLFFKCISFIDPKPLGVVLKMKYDSDIQITVFSNLVQILNLNPFREEYTEVNSYKRILSVKNGSHIILAEEDFIK